jgi:prepilin-type N-terminal cleavage/methylation domain-containing protein/prepilin-type processing-associated H-X9-DG protein
MAIQVCMLRQPRQRGFSLVELLVVIGIIALLISILLPAIVRAREEAAVVKCAAQLRDICSALTLYAADNHQRYPPNQNMPSPGRYWTDGDRIGRYLPNGSRVIGYGVVGVGGGVMVCPSDESSIRSYAMNVFASSDVDSDLKQHFVPDLAGLWSPTVARSSNMILVAECWAAYRTVSGDYYASPYMGAAGDRPGQKFGASGGISPPVVAGLYGAANSELPFVRHRKHGSTVPGIASPAAGPAPVGRVNIGYADGHVDTRAEYQLVDGVTGKSTLDSQWSPKDQDIQ